MEETINSLLLGIRSFPFQETVKAAFDQVITTADLLDAKYLLVQRGKKNYYLIIAK